jgi:hypothetical protein
MGASAIWFCVGFGFELHLIFFIFGLAGLFDIYLFLSMLIEPMANLACSNPWNQFLEYQIIVAMILCISILVVYSARGGIIPFLVCVAK